MNQRIIALWNEGDTHQAAGRLVDAERCFLDVAERMQGNPHPLDRLAQVLRGQGRLEEALALSARAVAAAPEELVFHNTAAVIADEMGHSDQAEDHYRRALLLAPSFGLWASLASLRYRVSNHHEAARAYSHTLVVAPGDIGVMFEHAAAHQGAGNAVEASSRYRAVLGRAPGHGPSLRNLAVLASDAGDEVAATNWLRKALVIVPTSIDLLRELGVKAVNQGIVKRAFNLHRRAIQLDPDDPMSWAALSDAGRRLAPDRADAGGLRDLVTCMVRGTVTPSQLIGPVVALLREQPGFLDACRAAASEALPQRVAQILRHGLPDAIDGGVFRRLLGVSLLPNPEIEFGLAAIRAALLELAVSGRLSEPGDQAASPAFILALAEQCQLNEHAWFESSEETVLVEALEDMLVEEPRWSLPALLLACYRQPRSRDPAGDESFGQFEQTHVQSHVREEAIAQALPVLTQIVDQVSETVRAQYEENPYPRWTILPGGPPVVEPGARPEGSSAPRKSEVLIAGCGTGQHALLAASNHGAANILAVDLSRASLAYAERMRVKHGVENVTFGQADILGLGALERRFDVIESVGVLHHMARPIDGWRVLVKLLAPDGVMRIGLYSELARQPVVRARALIADWALDGSAPAIREARRRLMLDRDNPDLAALFFSPDFFSLSTCRDLLFHVQEHRFTIPELQESMDTLGLEFLGFELPSVMLGRYRDRFTDDPKGLNLSNWAIFEVENPGCFGAMYQFQSRRRA